LLFFEQVLATAGERSLTSDEHFTVDGTLVEAWAGLKSFKRKDGSDGQIPPDDPGNPTVNFHGQKRRRQRLRCAGLRGPAARVRHRGLARLDWNFTFALAAYNLMRIRNLTASTV